MHCPVLQNRQPIHLLLLLPVQFFYSDFLSSIASSSFPSKTTGFPHTRIASHHFSFYDTIAGASFTNLVCQDIPICNCSWRALSPLLQAYYQFILCWTQTVLVICINSHGWLVVELFLLILNQYFPLIQHDLSLPGGVFFFLYEPGEPGMQQRFFFNSYARPNQGSSKLFTVARIRPVNGATQRAVRTVRATLWNQQECLCRLQST